MLHDLSLMNCQDLAVPTAVMQHVVHVESSFNPYAIGVVGGHLVRQPQNLPEAVATARMLDSRGYNFSIGLAQVNRYNLGKYGFGTYAEAFQGCRNLQAGARILAQCMARSGNDWGKSFSCYYSGNFITGYQQGYVQKIFASMRNASTVSAVNPLAIDVINNATSHRRPVAAKAAPALPSAIARRITPLEVAMQPAIPLTPSSPQPAPAATSSVESISALSAQLKASGLDNPVRVSPMGGSPASSKAKANGSGTPSQGSTADDAFVF